MSDVGEGPSDPDLDGLTHLGRTTAMTEHPLISIIISNYNYGRYLAAAINSALDQTYAAIEVIVVDDGSTDDSRDVIAAFGNRIRSVLKDNGGQASAFNAGFEASSGDVVIFLDADDLLLPGAAETVHPYFRDDHIVKVHWKLLAIDNEGHRLPTLVPTQDIPDGDLRDRVLEAGPNCFVNPPCSGNAWSRRFLSQVSPVHEYGDRHGADAYLFALAPLYGIMRRIDHPLSAYRVHPANFSGSSSQQLARDLRRFQVHSSLLAAHCAKLGIAVTPERWRANAWVGRVSAFIEELEPVIPRGAAYVLVDEAQLGYDILRRRYGIPFLEKDGQYWGAPIDDQVAREELDRLRAAGAAFIVFAWTAFWWLDVYKAFRDHLQTAYECVFQSERAVVFDLHRPVAPQIAAASADTHFHSGATADDFRYICPFCNSRSQRLLPFGLPHAVLAEKRVIGGGYRLNVLCPVCGSKDRDRLLYLYLINETKIFAERARVLYVAPEPLVEALLADQPQLDCLTADLHSSRVMVKMDITTIQYPDDSFDCIICNDVLEHIPDDRKAMAELYRVLKPGGWALLQVPISLSLDVTHEDWSATSPAEREQAFGQKDHVRIYAQDDYQRRLAERGFAVEAFDWAERREAFGGEANRFALNPAERVFIARKPLRALPT